MRLGETLRHRLRRRIFLITLSLLIAQVGRLAHALEHELDQAPDRAHTACLLCHAADHFGHGVPAPATSPATPSHQINEIVTPQPVAYHQAVCSFLARGPPATL